MSSKKVFVGSLAWATTDESLSDFFAQCGEVVEAKVITDRDTGRSRGFGFVTFTDEDGARKATELDGESLEGRNIHVDFARERSGGGGGGGGGRGGRGGNRGGGGGGGWR